MPSAIAGGGVGVGPIPQPLTVEDAVRIGLQRNPQITAATAGVAAAAATYRSNAAFPPVTLNITRVGGSSTAPTINGATTDTDIDVSDTVDTSGQRRYGAQNLKAVLNATRYTYQETRLSLAQQIRDAYWSLVSARAQTQMAQESLQDVQRVNQLTRVQLAAGASPRMDVVRSGVDVANAQQTYVSNQGAERAALASLNVLLGRPPLADVQLAENFTLATTTPALITTLPSLADLTRSAIASRPMVLSARAQVQAAEYALKQARASRYPDVSVDYQRSIQVPLQSVVVGAQLPLLDFGSIGNAIKAAQETRKQAAAQELQAEQQVAQQVAQAYTDYTQALQLTGSYSADIVRPSVTLLDMAQLGYKQGATGILPVIDAENTLRNARMGYVTSLLALYKARDEIEATVGSLPGAAPAPTAVAQLHR